MSFPNKSFLKLFTYKKKYFRFNDVAKCAEGCWTFRHIHQGLHMLSCSSASFWTLLYFLMEGSSSEQTLESAVSENDLFSDELELVFRSLLLVELTCCCCKCVALMMNEFSALEGGVANTPENVFCLAWWGESERKLLNSLQVLVTESSLLLDTEEIGLKGGLVVVGVLVWNDSWWWPVWVCAVWLAWLKAVGR